MKDIVKLEGMNLSDFELKIMTGALNHNSGQSRYQSEQFVTNSQLTPYRMMKQCLLELESRHQSWWAIKNSLKRKKIEIQIAEREMEASNDDLQKQLILCDIEDMTNDCRVWERKIVQAEEEIQDYLNMAKDISEQNGEEMLEKAITYDHEEERKYWITRMAKQAAMDMVAYGRIGSGNMDSIAMMPDEDQISTLATTLQYNERLMQGLTSIGEAVSKGLLENKEHLPKFDVPKVTDKLLAEINNVQHTPKSKTDSESI